MTTIRCRSCGEMIEGEVGRVHAALHAASAAGDPRVRLLYVAVARGMLAEIGAQVDAARLAIVGIESELACTTTPAQIEIGGTP